MAIGIVKSIEHFYEVFSGTTITKTLATTKGAALGQCAIMFQTVKDSGGGTTTNSYRGAACRFRTLVRDDGSGNVEVYCRRGDDLGIAQAVGFSVVEFIDDIDVHSVSYSTSWDDLTTAIGATIDLAYSFITVTDYTTSTNTASDDNCFAFWLSSTTQMTHARQAAGSGNIYLQAYVIEDTTGGDHFNVQHSNAVVLTDLITSKDLTFSTAVALDKTFIEATYKAEKSTQDGQVSSLTFHLDSTTTVQANRYTTGTSTDCTMYAQIIELQHSGAKVLRGSHSMVANDDADTVAMGEVFSEFSGVHLPGAQFYGPAINRGTGTAYSDGKAVVSLASTPNDDISFARYTRGTTVADFEWEAVDFGIEILRRIFIT